MIYLLTYLFLFQTFAIVGSECVFEIQVINAKARDLMVERIFQFVMQYSSLNQSKADDPHNASSFFQNNSNHNESGVGDLTSQLSGIRLEMDP
jgi:hypothetical protein